MASKRIALSGYVITIFYMGGRPLARCEMKQYNMYLYCILKAKKLNKHMKERKKKVGHPAAVLCTECTYMCKHTVDGKNSAVHIFNKNNSQIGDGISASSIIYFLGSFEIIVLEAGN
jgi:hypothetical protein